MKLLIHNWNDLWDHREHWIIHVELGCNPSSGWDRQLCDEPLNWADLALQVKHCRERMRSRGAFYTSASSSLSPWPSLNSSPHREASFHVVLCFGRALPLTDLTAHCAEMSIIRLNTCSSTREVIWLCNSSIFHPDKSSWNLISLNTVMWNLLLNELKSHLQTLAAFLNSPPTLTPALCCFCPRVSRSRAWGHMDYKTPVINSVLGYWKSGFVHAAQESCSGMKQQVQSSQCLSPSPHNSTLNLQYCSSTTVPVCITKLTKGLFRQD